MSGVAGRSWHVRPMGPLAVLIDHVDDPAALALAILAASVPAVDVVPAARTVLVTVARPGDLVEVRASIGNIDPQPGATGDRAVVEVDVVYDGDDLDHVAAATGLTPDGVIDAHASGEYRVDFCGFAPGFGYLSGLPPVLRLPRRDTPRARVPAGSVAIAAGYSAVYPTESPGGWHLIGRTATMMFDVDRTPPALLEPGTRVVFRPS